MLLFTLGGNANAANANPVRGPVLEVQAAMHASTPAPQGQRNDLRNLVLFSPADGSEEGSYLDADVLFAQGYVDGGGPAHLLAHLLEDVRPCEGEWFTAYSNGYVSAFQFTLGTWGAAAARTGFSDPLDPYAVGANVAWLINHIADPGSTAGWPTCWHRGGW